MADAKAYGRRGFFRPRLSVPTNNNGFYPGDDPLKSRWDGFYRGDAAGLESRFDGFYPGDNSLESRCDGFHRGDAAVVTVCVPLPLSGL